MKFEELIYNEVMMIRKDVHELKEFKWKILGAASITGVVGGALFSVILAIINK